MAQVELRDICMQFGENARVLQHVSLTVRDGEFLTLLGPSGCGKTTALNLIAGLLEPSSGQIVIAGRQMTGVAPKDRRVAMVFQDYALYPHMTVFQNLAFPLKALRWSSTEIQRQVDQVAGILNLGELVARYPRELSGGQRQRVALGRALVREPHVFLMDEPLSNLDARLRVSMRTELKRLHRQLKATVIFVTHDQAEAMMLSDRIAVLRDGILQQVETPRRIYDRPANRFVANFIGAVGMNFVACEVQESGGGLVLARGSLRLPVLEEYRGDLSSRVGQRVEVGLRPEHLRIMRTGTEGWPAFIEVVEHLGSEALVYVQVGGQSLVARANAEEEFRPDETVMLVVDWRRANYFDPETEVAVTRGSCRDVTRGDSQA
jgi:multiple sugar transport system ATP-binding protein